ncbi:MAG: YbjN domain-containing protein [Paracoccus sp. (in: a-proteobacteria)]|nr:YbjN domain-containing protein [Paracoccus sp. (in: a-proteobacteria)]
MFRSDMIVAALAGALCAFAPAYAEERATPLSPEDLAKLEDGAAFPAVEKPALAASDWAGLPARELGDAQEKFDAEVALGADPEPFHDGFAVSDKPQIDPSEWAGLPQQELADEGEKDAGGDGSGIPGSRGEGEGADKGAQDIAAWPEGTGLIEAASEDDKLAWEGDRGAPGGERVAKPLVDPSEWAGLPQQELADESIKLGAAPPPGRDFALDVPRMDGIAPQPDAVAPWLELHGISQVSRDGPGSITARAEGVDFTIAFPGCAEGDDCPSMRLSAAFPASSGADEARMMLWNTERRFARAYLGPDGGPVLDWDVVLPEALSDGFLDEVIASWTRSLRGFTRFIEE